MTLLLDEAAIEIKTTGEPSVVFGLGYGCGYSDCIDDFCSLIPLSRITKLTARVVSTLHEYTRSPDLRVRAIRAYRTSR